MKDFSSKSISRTQMNIHGKMSEEAADKIGKLHALAYLIAASGTVAGILIAALSLWR